MRRYGKFPGRPSPSGGFPISAELFLENKITLMEKWVDELKEIKEYLRYKLKHPKEELYWYVGECRYYY